jgi:hypothetical protein
MGYTNLEDARAGREARINAMADERSGKKAQQIIFDRDEAEVETHQRIDELAAAEAKGIAAGSRAGKRDAAQFFTEQGYIPRQMFGMVQQEFQAEEDQADFADFQQQSGLGMRNEISEATMEKDAIKISDALLQAAIQGAPDSEVNTTLDSLNVPSAVKKSAATMFLAKKADIQNSSPTQGVPQDRTLKTRPTPSTQRAQGIAGETDQLIQKLHERLAQQGQQAPQQGNGQQNA